MQERMSFNDEVEKARRGKSSKEAGDIEKKRSPEDPHEQVAMFPITLLEPREKCSASRILSARYWDFGADVLAELEVPTGLTLLQSYMPSSVRKP